MLSYHSFQEKSRGVSTDTNAISFDDIEYYDGTIALTNRFISRDIVAEYSPREINEELDYLKGLYAEYPEWFNGSYETLHDGYIELNKEPNGIDAVRSLYFKAEITRANRIAAEEEKVRQAEEDNQKRIKERAERAEYLRLNPPAPIVRVKREPTESEITSALRSMQLEYQNGLRDDEPTRTDAIIRLVENSWRGSVDYIMPVPTKDKFGGMVRIGSIAPKPNVRLATALSIYTKSKLIMLYGDVNIGKSFIALHTAMQLALSGMKVWVHSTEDDVERLDARTRVMLNEYSENEQERIRGNMGYTDRATFLELEAARLYKPDDFDLLDSRTVSTIKDTMSQGMFDVLIIDVISNAHTANENDNTQVGKALKTLQDLEVDGKYVMFVHHTTKKGETFSGAGVYLRRVSAAFFVQRSKDNQLVITDIKQKDEEKGVTTLKITQKSIEVETDTGTIQLRGMVISQPTKPITVSNDLLEGSRKERIMAYLLDVDNATNAEIVQATGLKQANVSKTLSQLVSDDKQVIKNSDGSYSAISPN